MKAIALALLVAAAACGGEDEDERVVWRCFVEIECNGARDSETTEECGTRDEIEEIVDADACVLELRSQGCNQSAACEIECNPTSEDC